jgi:aminopeptidase YwaD
MFPNPGTISWQVRPQGYRRRVRTWTALTIASAVALALSGCTSGDEAEPAPGTLPGPSQQATPTLPTTTPPATSPATPPATPPVEPERVSPDDVRVRTAKQAVRHLAGRIGPRPGTSAAYFEAADWVGSRLTELGWQVQRQPFRVPAGFSVAGPTAGLPVEAGRSANLIATRGDVVEGEPWLAVGAHLDTVPTSPGAEDNASGIGALLAVAEAVAGHRTRLPVVLVAFGAEEPRGPGEDDHHYGSRAYVASLSDAQRRSLRGMVSMDRVGVGSVVPVGSVAEPDPLSVELLEAAGRVGVPTVAETDQRSSDHYSFVREGLPGVRLGSTPYAGYHSPDDVVAVVAPRQLARVARVVVSWLR